MIVALLILFLLTSLGISYVAVTKGDKQIAGNQMIASQAFSYAEAGISEALLRMSYPYDPTPGNYIGQPIGGATAGWGTYIVQDPGNSGLDPQYNSTIADGLDNDLDAAVDESSEHYPETGSKQYSLPLATKLDYPWVKIRYKLNGANQVLLFGDHDNNPMTPPRENTVRGQPILIVTAAGRKGLGAKTVTVEAVKWPLPPVPGSVYSENNISFAGAAFYVDGHDHSFRAPYDTIPGATPLPGISSPSNAAQITSNLNGGQLDNVTGAGSDPSVATSNVNLDIQSIADGWSQVADITYAGDQTNPNTSGWGDVPAAGDPTLKIVHIQGTLTMSGTGSGAGVLIVDGDFHLGGDFNYNGVVIVLGNLDVVGGGNVKQIVGGVMVQGQTMGTNTFNGNVKFLYSSAMINQLYSLKQYEVSSWIDQ